MDKARNHSNIKIITFILLLMITVGYAAISTTLNINGTSRINNPTWNVHFENIAVTSGSVTGTNVTKTATLDSTTTVGYSITLPEPGDYYEFNVDAKNDGTIDAMIDTIVSKLNNVEITSLPSYLEYSITYSDGKTILENHKLSSGAKETYKVRIEFKRDIEVSDLPTTEQTLNLSFSVNYSQATNAAIPVDHSETVYSFNISQVIVLGQPLPEGITTYSSPEEIGKKVFIKSVIRNNIVDELYVGRIIDSPYKNNTTTVVYHVGTYYLRVGINEQNSSDKPIFEQNKQIINSMFVTSDCSISNIYRCYTEFIAAQPSTSGEASMEPYSGGGYDACYYINSHAQCTNHFDG